VKLIVRTLLTTLAATAAVVGVSLPAHAAVAPSRASAVTLTAPAWPAPHSTYSGIAAGVCHNASLWPQIAADNGARAPYWLRAGQRVVVRCTGASLPSGSPSVIHTSSSWVMPVLGAVCSSGYRTAARPNHMGIDLPRPYGTPIHAAAAGTVVFVGYEKGGAGWYLKIRHSASLFTVYMHQRVRPPLAVGTHVSAGRVIGYVGSTGDSTGNHLHFEVRTALYYHQVNPAVFLRAHGVAVRGC
jgi:murein DD-endopeptidase MepM/ murein hydrolase activator NlpD